MQHDSLILAFVIIAGIAIVANSAFMVAIAVAVLGMRKEVTRALDNVNQHAVPLLATSRSLVEDISPKLRTIANNLAETSETVRTQAAHVSVAMEDLVAKVQQQAAHAGRVTTSTLDAVDATRNRVQALVDTPIRIAQGVVNGVAAAVDRLFAGRHRAELEFSEDDIPID